MSNPGGSGRRPPNTYEGLLKFCIENTQHEDAPEGSAVAEMSQERRQWLQEVFNSLAENDPVKSMVEALHQLDQSEEEVAVEVKEQALEDIQMHCEDLDLARDFHKIGGFVTMVQQLRSPHSSLRWRAADLLATLVQNNPYCQEVALKADLMPMLLTMLDSEEDDQVRVKLLYAVSCLSRDVPEAQDELLQHDGLSVLLRAMQSGVEKLQTKASFMMTALCQSQPKVKEKLYNMGMVEQLAALLAGEHQRFHEYVMSALLALVQDNEQAVAECCRAELNLKPMLSQRVQELKSQEEHLESVTYAKQLLELCFKENNGQGVER